MAQSIELGLDTFGDVTVDADGRPLSQGETLRNVVEQAVLADSVGLAFFGVGEHHRKDFSIYSLDCDRRSVIRHVARYRFCTNNARRPANLSRIIFSKDSC